MVIIWCLRAQTWGEIDFRNNSDSRYVMVLYVAMWYMAMSS